ncbi:MAG: hypothetical protein PHC88_09970 [Terrimicrobiaceae bacterium]|nr:hypothetical protein [Terrimicrobiaceae bacterium]
MIRPIAFLAAILAAVWIGYQILHPMPVAPAVSTPEAQFASLATSATTTAAQLGQLCDAFPQLAARYLKDRPLQVTGFVESFYTPGLDGRRAVVSIYHGQGRQVVVVHDLDHYGVLGLKPVQNRKTHFLVVGNELVKVEITDSKNGDPSIETDHVILTRNTSFQGDVTFDRITPTAIVLNAATAIAPNHY